MSDIETAILWFFVAACAVVFACAGVAMIRAALVAKELSRKAKRIVPERLVAQMRVAQEDARRAQRAFAQLVLVLSRAAVALLSISRSVASFRAQLGDMRRSF